MQSAWLSSCAASSRLCCRPPYTCVIIHPCDLSSIAGASLFALQDKAANAADWAAIKGQKVTGASQSFALAQHRQGGRGAALPCNAWMQPAVCP